MSRTISKDELFSRLGLAPGQPVVLQALEDAGISRVAKPNISEEKQPAAAAVVAERFIRVCTRGDCRKRAPELAGGREVAQALDAAHCEVCSGSTNKSAVDEMVEAFRAVGWRRLCVVGGSPNARQDFESLVAGRIELRMVDGTLNHSGAQARTNLEWADRVANWGGTQLNHKVSTLYTGPKVIQFARRSVQELAKAMTESARRAK
ncbi:MAG: hypothetical protein IBJ10_01365 [Phycisphaerales bacterium]|nr:hypothetical protein [Phycisphaerales bacterium]